MEVEWLYADINNKKLRINKNDSMDIYSWRETKIIQSYWYKIKPTLLIRKCGYKNYRIRINKKMYALSRVVFKSYNNDWDIEDISNNNHIDHININSIDNRIENLRILTHQQNSFNTNAKGYTWDKRVKKWKAQISINGKIKYLGYFKKEEDARQSYLKAKEVYHKI